MRLIVLLTFLFFTTSLTAQTGIGTTTPDASAKLDVTSTNKGFLPPRVTLTSITDNTTISNPATGLLVYNTGNNVGLLAGYYYWNGANWATIATSTGSGVMQADIVKIFDSVAGTNVSIKNNGKFFTVPTSGRYLFDFTCSGTTLNGGMNAMNFNVRQGTSVISSDVQYSYNNNVHVEYNGKVEATLSAGTTYNVYVDNKYNNITYGSIETNDYCRVYMKQISGNIPITGQSVDYVSVIRTTSQTVNTGDNLIFNTINSGNIPYNSSNGNFTLSAGKTYRLTGSVSLDGSNAGVSAMDIAWKNAAGEILGNRGFTISANYSSTAAGNGFTDIVYTPSINTTVTLNVISSSANAKTVANYTYANIQQIGSSAIVNPWTLSGNDTYNNLGKVGIGNTSPTVALDITGDTKVSGVLTAGGNSYPTNAGTNGYALTTNAAGAASWNAVPPVGVITAYAGSTAPTGYLICNGAAVSRTTYAALYAIIGTTYGTGDGSTTFNLPDLTGRVPVGKNAGTFSTLGAKAGEETHTMTVNEMPAHKHTTSVNSASDESSIGGYAPNTQTLYFGTDRAGATRNWDTAMQSTGGGAAFNVLQPYTVINYIIKF